MVKQPRLRFPGSESLRSHDVMRQLLLLVVVHGLLTPVQSVNGVIWDKNISDFVPIVSKPMFAALNQEFLSRSREEETHNFQGKAFKFSYFEIDDVISSADNGTRITGYIGEIWNILAEYLNLTLIPDCSSFKTLGHRTNDSFTPGLLRMIYFNRTDIVARVEVFSVRLPAAQMTLPLKISRHEIVLKPKRHYLTTWMWKLYSRKVWFAILATYVILSICSYVFHVIEADIFRENIVIPSMVDSFFYNLTTICFQGSNTTSKTSCSRMIQSLTSLFALLIATAYNAIIFGYISQVVSVVPFNDMISLLENTEYTVLTLNGTFINEMFAAKRFPDHSSKSRKKRVFLVQSPTELYKRLCTEDLVTTFLSDEIARNKKYPCKLQTAGNTMRIIISSGISWQFKHKRSIDVGLMRLYESGILKAIHQHWLTLWNEDNNSILPEAIILEQVHFIYMVLFGGLLMSLVILILEQITFLCNK